MNHAALMAILAGGGMAALNDGLLACLFWRLARGVSPDRIFQGISAGLMGREAAMAGGMSTVLLGVLLHSAIAAGMAAAFVLTAQRMPALLRWPWPLVGLVYGVLLYAVMHGIVLPLSRAAPTPAWWPWTLADVGSHVLLVAFPIVWAARHWLAPAPAQA